MGRCNWMEVWERKGREPTADLVALDGFEHTTIDPERVARAIGAALQIEPGDRVLEVGCGAGMLALYLECDYVGVDYSPAMVRRFNSLHARPAIICQADDLLFRDKSFDEVFAFSVFQYFPHQDYARRTLAEMERVAREAIFVGDLPIRSHSPDHQLYSPAQFTGWAVSDGYYNPDRFNVLRRLASGTQP